MKIAIDTCVIVSVLVNEPSKPNIIQKTTGAEIFSPHSVHWEIANAISAMYKRKSADMADAEEMICAYKKIPITFVDVDLVAALHIAYEHNIYAYDAYILQCAIDKHIPLMTLDNRLKTVAHMMKITLLEV